MARKTESASPETALEQVAEALRAQGFETAMLPGAGAAGTVSGSGTGTVTSTGPGLRAAKYGCAAVLVASSALGRELGNATGTDTVVAYRERPGAVVGGAGGGGEIARLLDRGYQKFLKTSKFELPATAQQLQAIHRFTEELTEVTGGISLYNEALGTTSDLYQYDRVKGREAAPVEAARPWSLGAGPDSH